MKTKILKLIALGGILAFVALLWPVFTRAETSLAIVFVVVSGLGVGIAFLAFFGRQQWMLWAALGVWPGAIAGGLAFAGLALLTVGNGDGGFEGLVAGAIIILGVFIGGIAGAIAGGLLDARRKCRAG
ncbi:MAG: hypothetical protein O3B95_01140 [Chloroflexi bacterium]|nr:hypothetical protein [Chloroflexota bacterium]